MRKVLYTKFSRERRNEFQIMTRITEEDGIRRVWKLPLQKEGEAYWRLFSGVERMRQCRDLSLFLIDCLFFLVP